MKPQQLKAHKERVAKVRFRAWARRIPDNGKLASVLLNFSEKTLRAEFYRRVTPYLRFKPIPLESLEIMNYGKS